MIKDIFQLKISVVGSRGPFYRRILVPSNLEFINLHEVIQALMNWGDDKFFLFQYAQAQITDPVQWEDDTAYEDAYDAFDCNLAELVYVGSEFNYQYFDEEGEWQLLIAVENEQDRNPELNYPRCIEAVGGQLLEECKNIEDYYRVLSIFKNPEHEEYEDILEWLGDEFDPDFFDIESINQELASQDAFDYSFDLVLDEEEDDFIAFDSLLEVPHIASNELQLESARQQFEQYKALGEKAIAQVPDEGLFWQFNDDSNSIAIIVKHLWGNMLSRWTGFLTTDGEKEWRERDSEFEMEFKTRNELMDKWELGWACLFEALDELTGPDWDKTIYIRKEAHLVWQAVNRQVSHYAYHVGQIVFLAKMLAQGWDSLSIPKGKSEEFNQKMNLKK